MHQLHRCEVNAIISCIQSPSLAIHCEIWKPRLSLGSLVNQRDAQGQCLHTFMLGSKGNSLSECYWPTDLYVVLTDYKLKHLPPFFSFQWNTKTLCITSFLYSPESTNKNPCLSQHLPGRGGLRSVPSTPICWQKAEHTGSMDKETSLYLSLKAETHQWSYFNTKLAASKGLVAALSCGKRLLKRLHWNFNWRTVWRRSLWTSKPVKRRYLHA